MGNVKFGGLFEMGFGMFLGDFVNWIGGGIVLGWLVKVV